MLQSLRCRLAGVDKIALGKAVGVLAMSWLALPLLYIMFKKKGVKKEENETTSGGRGEDSVHE